LALQPTNSFENAKKNTSSKPVKVKNLAVNIKFYPVSPDMSAQKKMASALQENQKKL
jgi:hypothetical protein